MNVTAKPVAWRQARPGAYPDRRRMPTEAVRMQAIAHGSPGLFANSLTSAQARAVWSMRACPQKTEGQESCADRTNQR